MKIAFNISIVIFGVSAFILALAISANLGLMDFAFEPEYSHTPYIDVIQNIATFVKAVDKIDFLVTIFSGISSLITGLLKGHHLKLRIC